MQLHHSQRKYSFRPFTFFRHHLIIITASIFIASLATAQNPPTLNAAAIAVPDEYSALTAEKIFKERGNAVDAAVGIAFTLAVTYPEAGNIGGGGFMTLYINGKPYFIDYRERAPLSATKNMYLDKQGRVMNNRSVYGYRAAATPGTVAGMWAVQNRFGQLKWQQVLAPAINYAENGFIVSKSLAERKKHFVTATDAAKINFTHYFGHMKEGHNFKQPELAAILKRISTIGEKDFYHGKTADLIVADMQKNHGFITKRDLQEYRAVWRQPLIADWNHYQIITAPPPSSGGIGLIQLLKMKNHLNKDFTNVPLNSSHYIHLIAEIEKRVFADRAMYLGDPDFSKVPTTQLINDNYLKKRAAEVNTQTLSDTQKVQPGLSTITPEKMQTTHFSVIDKWGNAVSNTYTLNGYFGAGVVVDGAGFLLNDEMDDFSIKSSTANMFGVVGKNANAIASGKRPLSSMAPTILIQHGKVVLVIGTPGGSRIFTSIFQVMTDIYDFNLTPKKAMTEMRFHHQLLPANTIFCEPYKPMTHRLAKQLQKMGYILKGQNFNGDIQLIKMNGQHPDPVADPRGRGVAKIIN